jgi:hypothetical protein
MISMYWLIDIRPEMIASGYAGGYPFYCGKTVKRPAARLWAHFGHARLRPERPVCVRLNQCGEQFVRIYVVETVPHTVDWIERERHWIRLLRFSFPESLNVADGGSGSPGLVLSAERRAAISAFHKGKITPIQTRAKMSAVQKGNRFTEEHREKLKEAWKVRRTRPNGRVGCKLSAETRAKISASKMGKPWSPEHARRTRP